METLLKQIHTLLADNGITVADVNNIAAGTGPGTFTGLRIGVTTARALAQALSVPVYGVSSLRTLAQGIVADHNPGEEDMDILAVIDAKRGQVFAQLFRQESGQVRLTELTGITCQEPGQLISSLPGLTDKTVLAGGNGCLAFMPQFETAAQVELIDPGDSRHQICAVYLLPELSEVYGSGLSAEVLPVYVRQPDADKTVLLRKREPWLK